MDYLQYWKDIQVQRAGQPIKTSSDGGRTMHNVFLDGTQIGFHVVEKTPRGETTAFLGFDYHADEKDCFANASRLLEKGNFLIRPVTAAPTPLPTAAAPADAMVTPASPPVEAATPVSEEPTNAPDKAPAKSKRPGGKKARKAAAKKTAASKTGSGEASQPAAMH